MTARFSSKFDTKINLTHHNAHGFLQLLADLPKNEHKTLKTNDFVVFDSSQHASPLKFSFIDFFP